LLKKKKKKKKNSGIASREDPFDNSSGTGNHGQLSFGDIGLGGF
jgi:hypothetical protein